MQILIDNISFSYPNGPKTLDEISITIQSGEKVALVGENGSGKTTLARHLNGLLQPGTGRVTIGDRITSQFTPAKMASRVAYAFQNPDEQLFRQKVWDEVAFGPQNLGYSPSLVRDQVERSLEMLNLADTAGTNPRDHGYSVRKRITLASALAMDTPIIVFDEPTAGFDHTEQHLLSNVIDRLKRQGKTLIVITHDMDFAAENLDRFILLHQGRVIKDSPAQAFFVDNEPLVTSKLAAPQMVRLCEQLGLPLAALSVEQFLTATGSISRNNNIQHRIIK